MTDEFLQRLRKKPRDDGGTGGTSTESARGGTGDVRTPRVLTNVSILGEIHSVDVDAVTPCLNDVDDSLLMTDTVTYREPETYQESLDCAEHQEWRTARANERSALQERGVMRVLPTPTVAKPIKSRYVYQRKYNKDRSIKKYKAKMVALGHGQVPGVDI